ncbi:MAG: helix-turn-helix transcriptional regulator [Rhodospirillales bacterium]|nr:helix-turn-helix transcriptional regulator [Rhodospirillales bacterium]
MYDSITNVSNRIDSTLFDTIRKGSCLVSLGRRLAEVRRKAAINQVEFAQLFGVSQSAYKNYERDATEPPVHMLADICEKYDVNLNWLATGIGAQNAVNLKELSRRALIAVENHLNAKEVKLPTFKKADLMSFVLEYLMSHPDVSEKFLASIMETFVGDETNKQG